MKKIEKERGRKKEEIKEEEGRKKKQNIQQNQKNKTTNADKKDKKYMKEGNVEKEMKKEWGRMMTSGRRKKRYIGERT